MNEIVQWIITALIVAAATWFLIKRFKKSGSGCACDKCCSTCNIDIEKLGKCAGNEECDKH